MALTFKKSGQEYTVTDSVNFKIGTMVPDVNGNYNFRIHGYSPYISAEQLKEVFLKLEEINAEIKKGVWFRTNQDGVVEVYRKQALLGNIRHVQEGYLFFQNSYYTGLSHSDMLAIGDKINSLTIPF